MVSKAQASQLNEISQCAKGKKNERKKKEKNGGDRRNH